jgi:thiol-disulfide isomerase/thioredoxin
LESASVKEIILDNNLQDQIDKYIHILPINDSDLLNNSYYYFNFISNYVDYFLKQKLNNKGSYQDYLNLKNYIQEKFIGINRDFAYNILLRDYFFKKSTVAHKAVDSLLYSIADEIKDNSIKASIDDFIQKRQNLNAKELTVIKFKTFNGETTTYGEILEQKPYAKYIDFWASWYIPCIEQYPFLKQLKDSINDISFISFSIDDNEENWKSALAKYNMPAENNYLILDSIENKKLTDILELYSIPRFLITNKNNEIIYYNAASPDHNQEVILQLKEVNSKYIPNSDTIKSSPPPPPPGMPSQRKQN